MYIFFSYVPQQIYSNKKTEKKTIGVYINMCICKPSITNLNIIYINDAKKKRDAANYQRRSKMKKEKLTPTKQKEKEVFNQNLTC